MKQMISRLCCFTVMSLTCLATLCAETETVPSSAVKCTKEELMTFFPKPVVKEVLTKAHLSQDQVNEIAQELSYKDSELVKLVEEKAAKIEPNPFKDLSQRDLAIKIYRETLYEVFAKVLKAHGVTNEDQIQTLLDDMQESKSKLFIDCIRKEKPNEPFTSSSPSPSS